MPPISDLEFTTSDMAHGGSAIARIDGKAFFVDGALPGETALGRVEVDKGSWGRIHLHSILEASPDRVEPRERRRVWLEEPDLELLLVRFLNELIYLRDAEDLLLRTERIEIVRDGSFRLRADLCGERIEPGRHALASDEVK